MSERAGTHPWLGKVARHVYNEIDWRVEELWSHIDYRIRIWEGEKDHSLEHYPLWTTPTRNLERFERVMVFGDFDEKLE